MVYIILGKGCEPMEAVAPCDILRRGGVEVRFAGIGGRDITGGNGITVRADCTVEEMDLENLELIMLPGGMGGVRSILGSETALNAVRRAWKDGKFVTAICAAPTILANLGMLDRRNAVCYPGMEDLMGSAVVQKGSSVVVDGHIVTGEAAGSAFAFGLKLVEILKGTTVAAQVKESVHYHG